MECLNTLEDRFFESLTFFVPVKDDLVIIKTSVFQIGTSFFL